MGHRIQAQDLWQSGGKLGTCGQAKVLSKVGRHHAPSPSSPGSLERRAGTVPPVIFAREEWRKGPLFCREWGK